MVVGTGFSGALGAGEKAAHTRRSNETLIERPDSVAARKTSPVVVTGAWGSLELSPITLINGRSVLHDPEFMRLPKTWFFEGMTMEGMLRFLSDCGVGDKQLAAVGREFRSGQDDRGAHFKPTVEWALSLPRATHGRIAERLALDWRNRGYFKPFVQPEEDFGSWLENSGLSPVGKEALEAAVYHRDGMVCISDFAEIFSLLSDRKERDVFAGMLGSHPSLRVRLKLTSESDIENLSNYWGVGGRQAQVAALLKGLQPLDESTLLEIVQLLPPMPRAKVNTYPRPGSMHNCAWSVLNFFADAPKGDYGAFDELSLFLDREFVEIPQPELLGDVVVFLDGDNQPTHTAVHVAGGVMFTKNGIGSEVPWNLVELGEVARMYGGSSSAPKIRVYRAKSIETLRTARSGSYRGS